MGIDTVDGEVDHRLSESELRSLTHRLLTSLSTAYLAAAGDNGLFVPVPDAVPTNGQRLIEGYGSGLELVGQDDVVAMVSAWRKVHRLGSVRFEARPVSGRDTTVTFRFVDARAQYGVFLIFVSGAGAELISGERSATDPLRPRVTIVRQNALNVTIEVDDAMERILGHVDLVGRAGIGRIHPDDQVRATANWMEMLARPGSRRRMRLRQQHHDGRWIWFEVTLHNLLDDPNERCVWTEMIDISEEMAAHEFVVAQENLLRRLTDSLPVGVVQADATGLIVHRNVEVDRVLGRKEATSIHDLLVDVVDDDADQLAQLLTAAFADVDGELEVGLRHANGDVARCQVILRSLPDPGGGPSGVIVCVNDVTEPARLRDQLQHRATVDPLTECHNRASVLQELDRVLSESSRSGCGVAVVFIDLDGFKAVNDRRGHAAGDALLRDIGHGLKSAVRTNDVVGRFGGDEFLVVLVETRTAAHAISLAERVAIALDASASPEPPRTAVASVGVAWLAADDADRINADALITRAGSAMYRSKAEGLGRPVLFEPDMESPSALPAAALAT